MSFRRWLVGLLLVGFMTATSNAEDQWVVYKSSGKGVGVGKHIVLVSGDDEYRSEEALPMLGKILAKRHGFKCTVLFAINPKTGDIQPNFQTNIPGLEALKSADLMIMALRFRGLPDKQMKHIVDYMNSGKPIIGLRTSTHAFNMRGKSSYKHLSWNSRSKGWLGGFGRQVLGDTWINHHGHHGRESTRGIINQKYAKHPILRGVKDIWGPTDVYGVRHLVKEANVLVHGQVVAGMKPSDPPVDGRKNDPMMPLIWTKTFKGSEGKESRIFCTTMGASTDFQSEGLRRTVVNASLWCLGMEKKIPAKSNVDYVGKYKPTKFGFGSFTRGVKPEDHKLD